MGANQSRYGPHRRESALRVLEVIKKKTPRQNKSLHNLIAYLCLYISCSSSATKFALSSYMIERSLQKYVNSATKASLDDRRSTFFTSQFDSDENLLGKKCRYANVCVGDLELFEQILIAARRKERLPFEEFAIGGLTRQTQRDDSYMKDRIKFSGLYGPVGGYTAKIQPRRPVTGWAAPRTPWWERSVPSAKPRASFFLRSNNEKPAKSKSWSSSVYSISKDGDESVTLENSSGRASSWSEGNEGSAVPSSDVLGVPPISLGTRPSSSTSMSTITTATALPAAADSRTSSVDSTSSTSTKATSLCSGDELLIRATKKDQGIEVVVTETHPALEGDAVTLKGKRDKGEQDLQQKPTNTPIRNPEGWQEVYKIHHDFERTLEGGVKISLKRDELVEVQLGAGGGGSSYVIVPAWVPWGKFYDAVDFIPRGIVRSPSS